MGSVNCNYLQYVGNWIIVSAVHFWEVSREGRVKAARESPDCYICDEFWMLLSFVTFVRTIWLPNLEE